MLIVKVVMIVLFLLTISNGDYDDNDVANYCDIKV